MLRTIFQSSFTGKFFYMRKNPKSQNLDGKFSPWDSRKKSISQNSPIMHETLKESIFSIRMLVYIIFFSTLTPRITSFQNWVYPWLKWSFSEFENSEEIVADLMDVYGYSYFLSILIAPLPGWLRATQGSDRIDSF